MLAYLKFGILSPLFICFLSVAISCSSVDEGPSDTDASSDSDASSDADTSYDGPPDTSAQRFADTACYGRNFTAEDKGGRCTGNVGCTDLPDICGSCYCDRCADEYCIAHECNDGGNPECPGGFGPDDAG